MSALGSQTDSAMAVTEASLLTSFLLPPAPLSVSLPLQKFTEFFPKSRRDDEAIPALYRELQTQRAQDIERVKKNIVAEAKLGQSQQRHVRRIRQAQLQQDGDELAEMDMEAKLFPEHDIKQHRNPHSVHTLVQDMSQATLDVEADIARIESESQALLEELQVIVGDLSDLRFGRFSKTPGSNDGDLASETMESLKRIQQLSKGAEAG